MKTKILFFIYLIAFYTHQASAMDGVQLHQLCSSDRSDESTCYAYVSGVVDTIQFQQIYAEERLKRGKQTDLLLPTIIAPCDIRQLNATGQIIDILVARDPKGDAPIIGVKEAIERYCELHQIEKDSFEDFIDKP